MKSYRFGVAMVLAATALSAQDQTPFEPTTVIDPSPQQPVASEAPALPAAIAASLPEGANVIFYRAYAEPTVWATTVKVDGTKLVALGNKQWTAVKLEPGTYDIKTSWSFMSGQSGGQLMLNVEPGKMHFVEIVGQSQYAGGGYGYMSFRMGSGIGEVTGPGAPDRVASCCQFKEPKF